LLINIIEVDKATENVDVKTPSHLIPDDKETNTTRSSAVETADIELLNNGYTNITEDLTDARPRRNSSSETQEH